MLFRLSEKVSAHPTDATIMSRLPVARGRGRILRNPRPNYNYVDPVNLRPLDESRYRAPMRYACAGPPRDEVRDRRLPQMPPRYQRDPCAQAPFSPPPFYPPPEFALRCCTNALTFRL